MSVAGADETSTYDPRFISRVAMSTAAINQLLLLPKKRKMEIAEQLWLSAADERTAPVSAAHKKIVGERLKNYRSGKAKAVSHAELMRKLRAK